MSRAKRGKLLAHLSFEDLEKAARRIARPDGPPNRINIATRKRSVRHAGATEPMTGRKAPRPVKLPGATKKPLTLAQLLRKQKRERREEREG